MRRVDDPVEAARLRAEIFERHREVTELVDFPVYQVTGQEPPVLVGWGTASDGLYSVQVHHGDFFSDVAVAVWTERDPTLDPADCRDSMRAAGGDPQVYREERDGLTVTVAYRGLTEPPQLTEVTDVSACVDRYPAWIERMQEEAQHRFPPPDADPE